MAQLTSVPLWIYTNHHQKLAASFCFSVEILILLKSSVILLKSSHETDGGSHSNPLSEFHCRFNPK